MQTLDEVELEQQTKTNKLERSFSS